MPLNTSLPKTISTLSRQRVGDPVEFPCLDSGSSTTYEERENAEIRGKPRFHRNALGNVGYRLHSLIPIWRRVIFQRCSSNVKLCPAQWRRVSNGLSRCGAGHVFGLLAHPQQMRQRCIDKDAPFLPARDLYSHPVDRSWHTTRSLRWLFRGNPARSN